MKTASIERPVEAIPGPIVVEPLQTPDRLCPNPRCKKGPNGARGIVKSRRAKYCCRYCRVDVCRRSRMKPEQIEKPKRKRRSDAKYISPAERQRAHHKRHRLFPLPKAIEDYLWMRARRAEVVSGLALRQSRACPEALDLGSEKLGAGAPTEGVG